LEKKHNNHRLFRCNFSQDLLAPSTHATELRHRCARPGYRSIPAARFVTIEKDRPSLAKAD
jgi:hypothetical protein